MLNLGDDNAARLLEDDLIGPRRIELQQLSGDAVVLASPNGMHHGQLRLFGCARIAGVEAGAVVARRRNRQQLATGQVRHQQQAAFKGADCVHRCVGTAVNRRSVQPVSVRVQLENWIESVNRGNNDCTLIFWFVYLVSVTETAVVSRARNRSYEVHARRCYVVGVPEMVDSRDRNGKTGWMSRSGWNGSVDVAGIVTAIDGCSVSWRVTNDISQLMKVRVHFRILWH